MKWKTHLKEVGGAAIVATLLGCSMAMTLLDGLSVAFALWRVILTCALTTLACVLCISGKIPRLIAVVLVSGGTTVWALCQDNLGARLKETLVSMLMTMVGGEGSLSEHAVLLSVGLCIIFTMIAFLMTRLNGGVYPALLLFLFVLMGSWFIEKRLIVWYVMPGFAALAVLYACSQKEKANYFKAIPAALIAAVLAMTLVPAGNVTWAPLEAAAQKVRDLFNDYFMFTDPRTVYSVSSDGYQPQGDVLGGPATPRDADVMTVKTDRTLLLRGSIRRTYTGYSWVDNSINSRYLFIDPTRQALRDDIFDVNMNQALDGALEEISVSVRMLNDGTSTLFVPHRLKSLSIPLDQAAYYNESGEVFITRGVTYGDAYSFAASVPTGDHEAMTRLLREAEKAEDTYYAVARHTYMNLPAGLDNDVYWLTQALTEDLDTPYEKALAIREHLLSAEYTYTLDAALPPKGRDFVSHFLLDTKEGYCTYYASAMAVMARLAGMPSRYIEGYLVHADESGETLVRGENAHAWVEIYFKGAGWIAFDATPGTPDDNADDQSDNRDQPPEPTPTPTPAPEGDDHDGENSPESEATPEPTPEPTPTPTPEPQSDGNDPTPTPPIEDANEGQDESDADGGRDWLKVLLWILLILLILLILAALIRHRWNSTDPKAMAHRAKCGEDEMMIWYRSVLTLFDRMGFVPEGGETPVQFAKRLIECRAADDEMLKLARAVECQQYGGLTPDESVLAQARSVYEGILKDMSKQERMQWHMHCMVQGIGNIRQIP